MYPNFVIKMLTLKNILHAICYLIVKAYRHMGSEEGACRGVLNSPTAVI